MALPDVDFHQIRPYGSPASRPNAFEELTSILIRDGLVEWPSATVFYRFGNPDGGREGKGLLANGDVWAWQAKYFFAFGSDEIQQIHDSVMRVLETEPTLKRYYVALPYDLPAGDTRQPKRATKSAHAKWLEKRAEWEAVASTRGMVVEFIYVGAHELLSEISKPKHAGRLRYWFNSSTLSPDGLHQRLADVVAKAGRRYSPAVHVEVEPVAALDGLGRTTSYLHRIQMALAGIRLAQNDGWHAPKDDDASAFSELIEACQSSLRAAELAMQRFLDAARTTGPLPDIVDQLKPVEGSVAALQALLRERHLQDGRYYVDQAAALYGTTRKASEAIWDATALVSSPDTEAARRGLLLMTGRAGVGKTHLFCDVASRRISAGLPTLVALGQDFDARNLLPQIGELAQLDGNLDEVLGVLDAAGEAAGTFTMLMIDALNEGAGAERWVDDLRVLAGVVDRHPNLVLAVSCRTEFVAHVVGDADGFPRVAHHGFAEATAEAIDRYAREYNLERLTFPVLNPEYGNPLFLKLACEALATLGSGHFALGAAGLATICNAFMVAVNKRLASPTRCDYDATDNLVLEVARELADSGPGPYDRAEAVRIAESKLPGRMWSRSLLLGMIREGVLITSYSDRLTFGYQRIGDVLRATLLAERHADDVASWYAALGTRTWAERGTLGALAVVAPELLGKEVVDLLAEKDGDRVRREVVDAFVESIVLRSPTHTTDRTIQIIEQLLGPTAWTAQLWEQLVRVACVPTHPANAAWTHGHLMARPLPERDASWSEWLIGRASAGSDDAVAALLKWGWKSGPADESFSDDVARLATLALGWMLATPDRRVRDRATKALGSVGERGARGFALGLREFRGCDDPYVVERLAAAACAVALRSSDPATAIEVAEATVVLVADGWPEHLLTRDYLRRVSAAARGHGWQGPEWLPPYDRTRPLDAMPLEAITSLTAEPERRYSSIWNSLSTYGDFGRYVVDSALENFDVDEAAQKDLRGLVKRAIFSRVVELGWTPELHGVIERGRQGGHDGPVERYGKKYQWIGFYEVLGRLADNHQLRERWADEVHPFLYEYAEQLVYRDIDPTVLVPGGFEAQKGEEPAWFEPAAATFPIEVATKYPRDLEGVPDPLDLIALTDADGTEWLAMSRHANWTQFLPPEIAALKAPNLNVWMQIRGYLVPSNGAQALREWAADKDWDGRWMAENAEVHSRLLGAHPTSPDWDWADGNAEPRHLGDEVIPTDLFQPIAWYGGTGTSRDSASAAEATGFVPSRLLFRLLELRPGKDFRWDDRLGLAVWDPTVGVADSSTLVMRRDLLPKLASTGYALFWTVLLNKQRHDHGYGRPGPKYRWVSASASYIATTDVIECVSAQAWKHRPGSGVRGKPVKWTVRPAG